MASDAQVSFFWDFALRSLPTLPFSEFPFFGNWDVSLLILPFQKTYETAEALKNTPFDSLKVCETRGQCLVFRSLFSLLVKTQVTIAIEKETSRPRLRGKGMWSILPPLLRA